MDINRNIRITTLVENTSSNKKLSSEHGLAFWIEYGDKRILFDTGQTDIIIKNAKQLGIDLAKTNAIVISHGHYDHTGGLNAVLNIAQQATLYIHAQAIKPKFHYNGGKVRAIGIPEDLKETIKGLMKNKRVIWTQTPTVVFPDFFVTGRIPRITDFDESESDFFTDENCTQIDTLPDDQAIFFKSSKGLIVLLGCAHAGVANTLHYIAQLSGQSNFYALAGGMHLFNASAECIEKTIEVIKKYNIQKIGPAHCTGSNVIKKFKETFPNRFFTCSTGCKIQI